MKKVAFMLLVMSAALPAQNSNGYVFFAPGGVTSGGHTSMSLHTGGGVDLIVAKGLGVNLELGAVGPREHFSDNALGVFSPGGTYYFRRGERLKLEPFVNGGYSLLFRSGHENLFYFGGGVNYWMARRVGLRFEVRDHVYASEGGAHFWGIRLALAFR